jgi:hypothetical protein
MSQAVTKGPGFDGLVGHLWVTPVQISKFHRDRRYHILPAYAQDGLVLCLVFQGATDANVFEGFIEQLLQHCN